MCIRDRSGAVIHEVHHAHHHLHHHDDHHDDHHEPAPEELLMLANYLQETGQSVFGFFNAIDLDQSGEVDTYEFQRALKESDIADLPPWEMEPLMKALDMDGNGRINVPELEVSLGRIHLASLAGKDDHHDDHQDDHHDEFDAQSMDNMGGLASKMPLTATAMLVGSLSIMGFPLIGGFWSKEGIIANTWRVAFDDPRFIYPCLLYTSPSPRDPT